MTHCVTLLLNVLLVALCFGAVCPPPSFPGDATDPMYAGNVLARAARRERVPTDAEVYASANVQRVMRVFSESAFNFVFPRANEGRGPGQGPYSYFNLLKAVSMWPGFCNAAAAPGADLDTLCKRELASAAAQFAQEVGEHDAHSPIPTWRQGLYYYTELGCHDDATTACEYRGGTCEPGTWQGDAWPCPPGVKYFGRGAKQVSYNYNYGQFSQAVYGDVNVLLQRPQLVVANDTEHGWLALASAIWFYMTPQSPKPSMHDVVCGFWTPNARDISEGRTSGFGVLILIINGGIECGGTVEVAQAANRIDYYMHLQDYFGLPRDPPGSYSCTRMQFFGSTSSASIASYWEESYSTKPCGVSCQLVQYQTAWSIYDDPQNITVPYLGCVRKYYPNGGSSSGGSSGGGSGGGAVSPPETSPAFACTSCEPCVAAFGNTVGATDEYCAQCGANTRYQYWPCNVADACRCGSATAAPPAPTAAPPAPTAAPPAPTTPAPGHSVAFACSSCEPCVALAGNTVGATDAHCTQCGANTKFPYWPCNIPDACQCAAGASSVAPAPPTTASPAFACSSCATCVAVAGNGVGSTDDSCSQCGSGTQYPYWPCNTVGACQCGAGGSLSVGSAAGTKRDGSASSVVPYVAGGVGAAVAVVAAVAGVLLYRRRRAAAVFPDDIQLQPTPECRDNSTPAVSPAEGTALRTQPRMPSSAGTP